MTTNKAEAEGLAREIYLAWYKEEPSKVLVGCRRRTFQAAVDGPSVEAVHADDAAARFEVQPVDEDGDLVQDEGDEWPATGDDLLSLLPGA